MQGRRCKICFQGAKFYLDATDRLTHMGPYKARRALVPPYKARRAENQGWTPTWKGGVFGEGQKASSHQLGSLGECCKLPQRGTGWSLGRKRIRCIVESRKRLKLLGRGVRKYIVSQKILPPDVFWNLFFKELKVLKRYFTRIFCVQI